MSIQYEFALCEDNITHISEAKKTNTYHCFNCGGEMIVKAGNVRAHHYSHKNVCVVGGGEGILHYNFKLLLYNYMKLMLSHKKPLNFYWHCDCQQIHTFNALDGFSDVEIEQYVSENYKPDIILKNDTEIMIIEIIDKHDIENHGIKYITDNKIPLIKIYIDENMYGILLERYKLLESDILEINDDVVVYNIDLNNFCDNNIPVKFYLGNIFPCFKIDEKKTRTAVNSIPCKSCEYLHKQISDVDFLCGLPIAKKNIHGIGDEYETPYGFCVDIYYKSGKRFRLTGTHDKIKSKLNKVFNTVDFFEYVVGQYCFVFDYESGFGMHRMKRFYEGEWRTLKEIEEHRMKRLKEIEDKLMIDINMGGGYYRPAFQDVQV